MDSMARQKPSSHYNPVVQLEATEELFVITRYNQSPKRKKISRERIKSQLFEQSIARDG